MSMGKRNANHDLWCKKGVWRDHAKSMKKHDSHWVSPLTFLKTHILYSKSALSKSIFSVSAWSGYGDRIILDAILETFSHHFHVFCFCRLPKNAIWKLASAPPYKQDVFEIGKRFALQENDFEIGKRSGGHNRSAFAKTRLWNWPALRPTKKLILKLVCVSPRLPKNWI